MLVLGKLRRPRCVRKGWRPLSLRMVVIHCKRVMQLCFCQSFVEELKQSVCWNLDGPAEVVKMQCNCCWCEPFAKSYVCYCNETLEGNLCPSLYRSQSRSCQKSSTDHRSKHKMGPIRAIPDGRGNTGLQPKVGARCKVLSLCTARLRGGKQRYYYRRTSCLITDNGCFQLKSFKTLPVDKNLAKQRHI